MLCIFFEYVLKNFALRQPVLLDVWYEDLKKVVYLNRRESLSGLRGARRLFKFTKWILAIVL